jgi:hypothetical protein
MTNVLRALLLLSLTLLLDACGGGRETSDRMLTVETMEEASIFGDGSTNRFPRVRHPLTASIADGINADLFAEIFGAEWEEGMSVADAIHPNDNGIPPISDISYRVIENNPRFLSLAISAEGCGAYCEPFTRRLNYDAATGRRIPLTELFTEAGVALLSDSVTSWKRKEITDFLKETRQESGSARGDDEEYVEEMIAMYDGCLSMLDEYEEDFAYLDFTIDRGAVTIYLPRCSNHAMLALDELGDFSYRIDFTRWKHDLTPYGKKVLGV